ncbi:MAG: glycosyltransferase family 39 protein [Candidatus Riflebacteria bacterium]|nr:glycosyltransferase family 39 protein [Candidatus Riflebacteria bacterium]
MVTPSNSDTESSSSTPIEVATARAAKVFRPSVVQALLAIVAFALLAYFIDAPHLIEPTETSIASAARSMIESDDWMTPRVNGLSVHSQSPVPVWFTALGLKLFNQSGLGQSDLGARVLLPLVGAMTVLGCYRIGFLLFGGRVALLSAFAFLTSGLFFLMRGLSSDPFLALWTTWMVHALLVALRRPSGLRSFIFWCFAALSLLTGGVYGLLPLLGLVPVLWINGRGNGLLTLLSSIAGWIIFLFVGAGWFIAQALNNVSFLPFVFASNPADTPFFSFHLIVLLAGVFPWTWFFLGSVNRAVREAGRSPESPSLLLLSWLLVPLVVLSISRPPGMSSMLQLLVPAAILIGRYVARMIHFAHEEPFSFKIESALTLVSLAFLSLAMVYGAWSGILPDPGFSRIILILSLQFLFLALFGYGSMYLGFAKGMLLVMGFTVPGFCFFAFPGFADNEAANRGAIFETSREFLQRVSRLPGDARILVVGKMPTGIDYYTGRVIPTWNIDRGPSFGEAAATSLNLGGTDSLTRIATDGLYIIMPEREVYSIQSITHRTLEHQFTTGSWSLYKMGGYRAEDSAVITASFTYVPIPVANISSSTVPDSPALQERSAAAITQAILDDEKLHPASGASRTNVNTKTHTSSATGTRAIHTTNASGTVHPASGSSKIGNGKPDAKPSGSKPVEKPVAKPDAKNEAKPAEKPVVKPEGKSDGKPDSKPVARPEVKADTKPDSKPVVKPEVKPDARPVVKPAAKTSDAKPVNTGQMTPEKSEVKTVVKSEAKPISGVDGKTASQTQLRSTPKASDASSLQPAHKTHE